jgi:hypothetical protein
MSILGEIFQPWPNSRPGIAPVPSVAIPPAPLAPVKFSGLIERDSAFESRDKLPRCTPKPLNAVTERPFFRSIVRMFARAPYRTVNSNVKWRLFVLHFARAGQRMLTNC